MSYHKFPFFLLISLLLIFCQDSNNTQSTPKNTEKKDLKPDQPEPNKDQNLNTSDINLNNTSSQRRRRPHPQNPPFNISVNEMDTIIFCSMIVQEHIKTKAKEIDDVSKRLNLTSPNQVYEKYGTDIFEKCNKNMDIKKVNTYIKNLTYFYNFKWEKDFDEFTKIDLDKYANETDLRLTMDQQILMYKYSKVNEMFRIKKADDREKIEKENRKIKIGQIDMDSIPIAFKFGIFLAILVIFFGGIFYFLKTLQNKPKDKKKKEKKKKTQ